jgi:hypothetical protein
MLFNTLFLSTKILRHNEQCLKTYFYYYYYVILRVQIKLCNSDKLYNFLEASKTFKIVTKKNYVCHFALTKNK